MTIITWVLRIDQDNHETIDTDIGEISGLWSGEDVAQVVVEKRHLDGHGHSIDVDGLKIEIMSPQKYSGVYEITVHMEPTFSANRVCDT